MNKHFRKLPGDLVLFAVWNIGFLPFGLFLQIMAGDSGEMPPILCSPAFYLIVLPNLLFILYFLRKFRTTQLKGENIESFEGENRSEDNPVINFLHRHNLLVIAMVLLNVTGATSILDVRKIFGIKEMTVSASLLFETLIPNAIIVAAYLLFYFYI